MRTVVLIGAGSDEVRALLSDAHDGVRAVVFSPDRDAARDLEADRAWAGWITAGRTALLVGPDYAGASRVARDFTDLHEAPVIVSSTLQADRPDEVDRARQAIARVAFQSTANSGARRASAARYLLQTLANAPRLARESHTGALVNLAAGVPAVIAAAGPSLDRNIHDLAPILDRALVIACDTAARPLVSVGVEPDFIVGTDSSRANAAHLSSLPATRSVLVAEGSLHPSAFVHFDHRTFIFRVADHEPWPWLRSLGLEAPTLETWGSVATSAFSLALTLGCDPIVFVGADFAFTDGRPYCRGTSFEALWAVWMAGGARPAEIWSQLIDRWPAVWQCGVTGESTRTASHLVSFRDWIAERAAAHPSCRVINATGAGILAGSSIEQGSATAALAACAPLDRDLLRREIARTHRAHRGDLERVLTGVDRVLDGQEAVTVDRWVEFGAPGVSPASIAVVLRSHEHDAWSAARMGTAAGSRRS